MRIGTNPLASYLRINQRASDEEDPGVHRDQRSVRRASAGTSGATSSGSASSSPATGHARIKGSREVWPNLQDAMANSIRLGGVATIVGITIGLSIGVFAALRPGSLRDTFVNTGGVLRALDPAVRVGRPVPAGLRRLLGRWYGEPLLPTSGVYPTGSRGFDLWLMVKHMVLPVTVVAIQMIADVREVHAGVVARGARTATTCARRARRASANGRVLVRHALRNALIPVVTVAAIDVGAILGGLIITESMFSYPGMGEYFLAGVHRG